MRFGTAVPVASGATGRVVRAFDHERGEDVALKLLHRDDPAWVQRMLREAEVQMRLDHPHICKVYATGRMGEQPWIAMRLVEGDPLDVAAAGLADRDKAALLAQVADAIAYAHQQGVVHRDLKPSNIMVEQRDGKPHAVVVDFGLVHDVDAPELTRTGQLLGTPGYMAPEQATDAGEVDGRADIFSLGVVAFELFAGRRPFSGESAAEILLHTLRHEPPSLQTLRPDIDPALARIVRQCLETDRSWRYADAATLREDLLAFRDGRRVHARSDNGVRRMRRFARRHPWRAGLGATAAVLLAGVVGLATYSSWYARQQSIAAQRYTEFSAAIENAMRLEFMKPAHDVGAARQRVLQRIERFASSLPHSGPSARRSGQLALGRALASMGEDAAALEHLQAALDAGEDGLQLHAALGQALLRQYFGALRTAAGISSHELRAERIAAIDARYRERTRAHLQAAAGGGDAHGAQMQALLSWLDGESTRAEQRLAAIAAELPWPVDALLLAGELAATDAARSGMAGDVDASLQRTRQAREHFERAADIARSHPGAASSLCQVGGALVTLLRHGAELEEAEYRSAMQHCDRAIALDSRSAAAHASKARALVDLGLLLRARGQWSEATFEEPLQAARSAVALAPGSIEARRAHGAVLMQRAYWHMESGSPEALHSVREATEVLEQVQREDPADAAGAMLLANAYRAAARAAAASGADSDPYLVSAQQALQRAIDGGEAPLVLEVHLIDVMSWRGYEAFMAGRDPGTTLEDALARGRKLFARAPGHPRVAPTLGMAGWNLAVFRSLSGDHAGADAAGTLAVDAYRHVLEHGDPGFATLFNAIGALQTLATQRVESGQAIGAELAEMQRWTQRLLEKAGTDNPIDIQLGSIGYLQALEAIRAGEDPRVPAESARHYLATATDNPIDAREAHLLLAQLACAEHRWNLGQDRFDPQRAESDADTVLAAVRQYPDSAWLKAEAARLLSILPPRAQRRARARALLDEALAQMPLLSRRFAPVLQAMTDAGPGPALHTAH